MGCLLRCLLLRCLLLRCLLRCGNELLFKVGNSCKQLLDMDAMALRVAVASCAFARGYWVGTTGAELGHCTLHLLDLSKQICHVRAVASFALHLSE